MFGTTNINPFYHELKNRPKLISELHGFRGKGTKKEIGPSRDLPGGPHIQVRKIRIPVFRHHNSLIILSLVLHSFKT